MILCLPITRECPCKINACLQVISYLTFPKDKVAALLQFNTYFYPFKTFLQNLIETYSRYRVSAPMRNKMSSLPITRKCSCKNDARLQVIRLQLNQFINNLLHPLRILTINFSCCGLNHIIWFKESHKFKQLGKAT